MYNNRQNIIANIPPAVKLILIINIAMFLLTELVATTNHIDLNKVLGLYFFKSDLFKPYQIITHMFMHGGWMHILFNMYALWLFGQVIERVWGTKRFFVYYFVTGFGAVVLHSFVEYLRYLSVSASMPADVVNMVLNKGANILASGKNYADVDLGKLNLLFHTPTIGASGAIFGLLLAFGMLFPNTKLYLLFVPVPIKAKYFVIGYGVLELGMGLNNATSDNVAHFAHLGGMLFGFILIKIWQKKKKIGNGFHNQY
ncbi:MAG: rhomboid family intramembrane serine protease [Bacteroidales bacterium]|nr:rhomboid family intramembrane serine protease [Bacteroidales bacterium]